MKPISLPEGEHDVVHVFHIAPEAAKSLTEAPFSDIEAALGASGLDRAHVDVFAVSDLQDLGLVHYLTEGLGVDPAALTGDRDKLEALTGHVVILAPGAAPAGATLHPGDALAFIGSYREFGTGVPALTLPHETPADEGPGRAPRSSAPEPEPGGVSWVTLAMGLAVVLVLAIAALLSVGS